MREYIRTLTLAEDFVAISSQVATVVLNTNLIVLLFYAQSVSFELGTPKRCFQDQVRRLLTPTTAVYLGVSVYGAVSQMGLVVYEFVRYNYEGQKPPHDFYLLFWLGTFSLNYVAVSSATIFFLSLERCLSLSNDSWSADETRSLHNRFAMASVCVIFFIYASCAVTLLIELPLQEEKIHDCVIFTCMLLRLRSLPHIAAKAWFAGMNVFVGAAFYRKVRQSSSFKDPMTGEPAGNFVGPMTTTCAALENALVTICYTYILVSEQKSIREIFE